MEGFQKLKWKSLMEFSIKRLIPPLMAQISIHLFTQLFFLLQLDLTFMKQILHLVLVKIIILKAYDNWFKIDNY